MDNPHCTHACTAVSLVVGLATAVIGRFRATRSAWAFGAASLVRHPRGLGPFGTIQGTSAITDSGEPEPFASASGPSTSVAPVAGIRSRCARHSMAILCVLAISVLVA